MSGIFPLWKIDTRQLLAEFISLGFRAVVCCVNDAYLGEADVGRHLDGDFMRALPPNIDPCGENGEYHSFAFAGPIFREPLALQVREKVYRPLEQTLRSSAVCPPPSGPQTKGFWFCDLTLADSVERKP
jgi:diphthamide synthase (EF-2-diphthine--ammonia ligase)